MTVVTIGDSHAKKIASAAGPPATMNCCNARVEIRHAHPGRGVGGEAIEEMDAILGPVLRRHYGDPSRPAPDAVVVSMGGNALTTKECHYMCHYAAEASLLAVAQNLRRVLVGLTLFGARGATVIVLSAVPRARLSPGDLDIFRRLSNALEDVVEEFAPHSVFLDVERLLKMERSSAGSWRRRPLDSRAGGDVVGAVQGDAAGVSSDPLGELDFADGLHLHQVHYETVRAAVEEVASAAALLPHPPLPIPDCGRMRPAEAAVGVLAPNDARRRLMRQ